MEVAGVIKLYEPSPTPCMYVALAQNMVGRVPLIPQGLVFLLETVTQLQPFPTYSASVGIQTSRLAVLTLQLWMEGEEAMCTRLTSGCGSFGRGKPRFGGLTVEQTTSIARKSAVADKRHKAVEAKQCSKAAPCE